MRVLSWIHVLQEYFQGRFENFMERFKQTMMFYYYFQ